LYDVSVFIKDNELRGFQTFLISFRGGSLKQQQAEKHALQVSYLMRHVSTTLDEAHQPIASVIERKLSTGDWLPNTARTCLNSLKLFLKYVALMSPI